MTTIKNLLNQPQMIDERSLAVDGELKVKAVSDEMKRLAKRGFIAIVEDEPEKPAGTGSPTGGKENK